VHGGYRLKRVARENLGTDFKDGFLSNGWKILRSYPVEPPIPSSARDGPPTHILGVLRDGRFEVDGNFWWLLFHPEVPRLALTAVEKDTLEAALENATDEEIASRLGISIWAVKKRWQGIYAKAEQMVPGIFPSMDLSRDTSSVVAERRRHLLGYVRQHPEEIRPRSPD
jgi:hypothetical protein